MSNLHISSSKVLTTAAPALSTDGFIFYKSNRVLSFILEHTVGAGAVTTATIYGYKNSIWYQIETMTVDTSNDPMVYDVNILSMGYERIYVKVASVAGLTSPSWALAHECHFAGGR